MSSLVQGEISLSETCVAIHGAITRRVVVAGILGSETDAGTGKRTIWLDRLVHSGKQSVFSESDRRWVATGAVSTVLSEQ